MSIYTVFRHKVDIYTKSVVTNAAGQQKPTWTLAESRVSCHFIPRVAIVRTGPTYEEVETTTIFFPPGTSLDYGSRLYNLVDKFDNVLEAGPMELDAILTQPGFSGKIHHIATKAKRVMER